ncbi:hypothetical protein BD779DRAFT_1468045 [Infundibulicybe gibba]|nr:hypothetical protein BD779DRAFT_1468045 [Infundibulicybe gibba]
MTTTARATPYQQGEYRSSSVVCAGADARNRKFGRFRTPRRPGPYLTSERIDQGPCLLLSFLAAFALRARLSMLNERNRKSRVALLQEGEKEDKGVEVWGTDPRYVFMT